MIEFKKLPGWAKRAIRKAGEYDVVQEIRNNDSLQITNGQAFFNGEQVQKGKEKIDETPIDFYVLPEWAKKIINKNAGKNSTVQSQTNGQSLQIFEDKIFFDGRIVNH